MDTDIINMDNTKSIHVLDTGDDYILAFQSNNGMPIVDRAKALYNDMGVFVIVTKLNYITSGEEDFIKSTCGRIIPYSPMSNQHCDFAAININAMLLQELNADIGEMIKFDKIQKSWIKKKSTQKSAPNAQSGIPEGANKQEYVYLAPYMNAICNNSYFIIYNKTYDISLVVFDDAMLIRATCAEFTDFVIVDELKHIHKLVEFKVCFDKKSFENLIELENKLDAYKKLYNVVKPTTSKTLVFNILETLYTVTPDKEAGIKIRASTLYDDICSNLHPSLYIDNFTMRYFEKPASPVPRKALIGICLEYGLERTRDADGHYYYHGISARFEKKQPITSMDDIIEKRAQEAKDIQEHFRLQAQEKEKEKDVAPI